MYKAICFLVTSLILLQSLNAQQFGTLKDSRDGKIYKTVKIGEQVWMAENLSTDKFRNGDIITQAKNIQEWKALNQRKKPAWIYYEFKAQNGLKYGRLYNWYAVNDSRGLAPDGYKVPSNKDWAKLIDYLEGPIEAGINLKSSVGWDDESNGSNKTGFTALPGGSCDEMGYFSNLGGFGAWWSSTEATVTTASYRSLSSFEMTLIDKYVSNKGDGYSIRCLQQISSQNIDQFNKKNEVVECPSNFKEISNNEVSGTARKYKATNGKYYYEVKLTISPNVKTKQYTTRIEAKRIQESKNVEIGLTKTVNVISGSNGTFTFKGCFETDKFEIEGFYSCKTGRFSGPSATVNFRDLKIIQ